MRARLVFVFCLGIVLDPLAVHAQQSTAPVIGLADRTPTRVVLSGARLVLGPGDTLESGAILLDRGRIQAVGRTVDTRGALVRDVAGKTIFPGFIEPISDYGVEAGHRCGPPPGPPSPFGRPTPTGPTETSSVGPARHWNARVCPERRVADRLQFDTQRAANLRKLGFTAALAVPQNGIFRGQSALLLTADSAPANARLLAADVGQHLALEVSFTFGGDYPGSLMGSIALVRQTLLDATWHAQMAAYSSRQPLVERGEANASLAALAPVLEGRQRVYAQGNDELDLERWLTLRDEFGLDLVLVGTGTEYRRLELLRRARVPLILPLGFPEAPPVEDEERALDLSLAELEHWELAPFNPALLDAAGIEFAFTSAGLERAEERYWRNLRRAVRYGLPESRALAALTTVPARLLGQSERLGRLAPGHLANLVIADRDWFSNDRAKLYEVWVEGRRHELEPIDPPLLEGRWRVEYAGQSRDWQIAKKGAEYEAKDGEQSFPVQLQARRVLLFPPARLFAAEASGTLRLEASLEGERMVGRGPASGGALTAWSGTRLPAPAPSAAPEPPPPAVPARPTQLRFPAGEYGRHGLPEQPDAVVFRAATVWMSAADGPLEATDVLLRSGRIAAVGRDLEAPRGALEIDARGKHLTPGLIDPHSHIAISGNVNEPTHIVTSEVRIGDVLDPTDINIYRQLAGGVTTALVLHGSANAIGGQSQVIKLRWGAEAEQLKFSEAPGTIKFALGENPKQSNWGDNARTRYPQTRMGVEQIIVDAFTQAQSYAEARRRAERERRPHRRDLRLEALVEILDGRRMTHVHSYRQDEILMMLRVGQRFGFPIAAFQHVLEGYKVAPELAAGGAGASSFADWWSFKFEAFDAIPYNMALMQRAGVLVTVNSDSPDLARRLNLEAAKAVKYGGLSATAALALVTRNAAKQLRVDALVGSIEPGKHADLVLWSAHPLSTRARVEQTWIDGRRYFDLASDAAERERIESERARLIQAALPERVKALAPRPESRGEDGKAPPSAPPRLRITLDALRTLPADLAARRPPYHAGEPIHVCIGTH